jgi:drug/metabolite transporter (DMT)-like permease
MLGEAITARFMWGTGLALAGIALLLVNEAQLAPLGGNVLLGTTLALLAMLAASIANVVQAGGTGRSVPLISLLAWSMLYGTIIDGALAFGVDGPPLLPTHAGFWLGTAWLALAGSVVTFPLYYQLVRDLGAGRAAYNGVLVVVIAMGISTLFEGYRWTSLAAAGAVLATAGMIVALRARQVKAGL